MRRLHPAPVPTLVAALLTAALLLAGCAGDSVKDRRYGQVLVCHDGKTLAVSNADSFVHLEHGDTAGPCPDS
jgi:hypothetical protein